MGWNNPILNSRSASLMWTELFLLPVRLSLNLPECLTNENEAEAVGILSFSNTYCFNRGVVDETD